MIERTVVTPERLIEASSNFGNTNKNVRQLTEEMIAIVNSLNFVWEGEAHDTYNGKFMQLQNDMDRIYRMIDKHVTDLIASAENYKAAETGSNQSNSSLPNNVIK